MATTIKAGNVTGGTSIASDGTGILELKTGTGSGTTALTLDASQNATFAGTITSAGVITSPTGALYPLVSSTVQSATGSAIEFTGIPSTVKRITVMFYSLSTTDTSPPRVQLGTASSYETTNYSQGATSTSSTPVWSGGTNTNGFYLSGQVSVGTELSGTLVLTNISGNVWIASLSGSNSTSYALCGGGFKTLFGGALTRLQLIPSSGTFDSGLVNVFWE